ncbi:aspartate aminotransferase family protein [Halobacteriales archaeon QS_8_69_26]|nr:MAG: aspartate aminotransferase family protein [Halobacteriales archaeon QS_8_69_26]
MSGFVFSEKPVRIERGRGPYLYDDGGNEYLDIGASYAVTPVGHCHPAVVAAVQDQVERLMYVQGSYPVGVREELHDHLGRLAPGVVSNVWLCNSGTEANEAALKFARSATGRSKVVAATRGFHGRTMGALSATWKAKYRDPFEPLVGDVEFVDYGDSDAMAEAVDDETAAVILEPIQGEGGIRPASGEYLRAVREVTEDAGAALVLDEIQTGLGRTGSFWACERHGVVPDVLTTAKGLASGLPAGATLCADWIAEGAGPHGSTFSGGPVVSAAANATLSTVESEGLVENAAEVGAYLREELETTLGDDVREVRGEGLLVGIEVRRGANRLLGQLAMDHGVLALPAGRTVLRLLPPLTVDRSHADRAVSAIAEVVG